jgi:hypothetical protein
MKRNLKLLLLMDTITVWKDADILKVTVATVLYKHLATGIVLRQYNILKLYYHLQ